MAGRSRRALSRDKRRDIRRREPLKGNISYRDAAYPCLLEDFSENGMRLLSAAEVAVGERVAVDLQLCEGQHLPCVLHVRHIDEDGFGGRIVEIEPANKSLLVQMVAYAEH
jgi:hypothetical protein